MLFVQEVKPHPSGVLTISKGIETFVAETIQDKYIKWHHIYSRVHFFWKCRYKIFSVVQRVLEINICIVY